MANINKIKIKNTSYSIEDSTARSTANTAKTTADSANNTATAAKTTADTAKSTADSASRTANTANNTANTARNTANTANSTANEAYRVADYINRKHIFGENTIQLENNKSYLIACNAFSTAETGMLGIVLGGYNIHWFGYTQDMSYSHSNTTYTFKSTLSNLVKIVAIEI